MMRKDIHKCSKKTSFMKSHSNFIRNQFRDYQSIIIRVITLWMITFCMVRLWEGALPNTFYPLHLAKPQYDFSYWFIRWTQLDLLILKNALSANIFTVSLFVSLVLLFIWPKKWGLGILAWLHLFLLYAITNIYIGHNQHYLAASVTILLVACLPIRSWFSYAWEGMRFFTCWLYASAFLWKLWLGAFTDWGTGVETVKTNMAAWMYHHPKHFFTDILAWGISHPFLFNAGHKAIIIAEGFFIIGFFTKKYDLHLIVFALLIFISTMLFSDVFFVEQLIILFPLLPLRFWKYLNGHKQMQQHMN